MLARELVVGLGLLGGVCSFQAGRLVAWPTQHQPRCHSFCGDTVDFLVSRFGSTEEVAKEVEGRLLPDIATEMTHSRAAALCDALQARLGLSEAQLQKVVVALPAVLSLSFESNLEPSLAKLQARLGLSEAQLQKVVVALPSVLGYSFESNLSPTLDFLQRELALSLEALRERVVRMPALLGYSLAKRYQPRLETCRVIGLAPIIVIDRITLSDVRFNASIGL